MTGDTQEDRALARIRKLTNRAAEQINEIGRICLDRPEIGRAQVAALIAVTELGLLPHAMAGARQSRALCEAIAAELGKASTLGLADGIDHVRHQIARHRTVLTSIGCDRRDEIETSFAIKVDAALEALAVLARGDAS